MTTAYKKRVPNTNELTFIQISSGILAGKIQDANEIKASVNGSWQEIAIELYSAYHEDGVTEFWKVYDASARDRPQLDDWREMVRVSPEQAAPGAEKKERSYQLHPLSYLKNRPKREWGVDHIVLDKGVSVFVGDGGSGKSTFVLNMDIARACGIDFIGKTTKPAFVIWVAAESIDELYDRVIAMLKCNQIPEESLTNFLILDGRMPFNNTAEVDLFIQEIQEQLQELDVTPTTHSLTFTFDTYARCTPGADENNTQETKLIVDSMLKISDTFNAQVKTIHHVNAQGRIRGNTAFRDAVDTMWIVTKEGSQVKLHCDKMRGRIEPEDFQVEIRSIILDPDNIDSTAPVIFSSDAPSTEPFAPRVQIQLLDILQASGQLSCNIWAANCEKAHKISYSTFHNHRKHLLDAGLVEFLGGKPEKGKRATYVISKAGEELLG
ncbi:MAG: AAA family ATPase [Ktedonobacteraceae bacterium]